MYRLIAKQGAKREQPHPVYFQAVQKHEKEKSANTKNDYKTQIKNEQIKRKQTCSV